jgi:hypothetical protein
MYLLNILCGLHGRSGRYEEKSSYTVDNQASDTQLSSLQSSRYKRQVIMPAWLDIKQDW